jgi:hypothetical protein
MERVEPAEKKKTAAVVKELHHELKQIQGEGRDAGKYVVCQNECTHSCSLIAVFNIMVLKGDITIL